MDTIMSNMNNEMFEKKIELLLEMQNKHMMDGFAKIQAALQVIASQVAHRPAPAQAPSVRVEPARAEPEKQAVLKTEEPVSRPRYGDYTPEEVSVSKFFYFGNKK
ncbi:MAG TPA: hypothetical protein VJH97_03885 [Candidatus Nanoarchaeia archaeon]|nr:hypothetical protein [Candidatus Nanoarchaeia archaeon]